MVESHEDFSVQYSDNQSLWRYMDFTKFISLLQTRSLFFSRPDLLGDPFECSYPKPNINEKEVELVVQQTTRVPEEATASLDDNGDSENTVTENEPLLVGRGGTLQMFRALTYNIHMATTGINCWFAGEHESAAMWQLYLKSHEGIAIRTSLGALKSSIDPEDPLPVWLGSVTYLDYDSDKIPHQMTSHPYLFKRKSFEHEHEVRAITHIVSDESGIMFKVTLPKSKKRRGKTKVEVTGTPPTGRLVGVDLNQLIQEIYVAPNSPVWFGNLVESVARHFDVHSTVIHSRLEDRPLF